MILPGTALQIANNSLKVPLSTHFKFSTYLVLNNPICAKGPPKDVNPKVRN